jgi:hypothetical protein
MQQGHAGLNFKDMQQRHKMQHEVQQWHGHAARRFSREMQQGHAAWKYSMDLPYVYVARTYSMDMQYVHVAWTQYGRAA